MVQHYELRALTPPGSLSAESIASTLRINNQGVVAGSAGSIDQNMAFLSNGSWMRVIDALRPYDAIVQDISDAGHIVGHIVPERSAQKRRRSFFLHHECLDILDDDVQCDSAAVAVNNRGHTLVRHNGWQSFIYQQPALYPLDPTDAYRLQAQSINDSDHVVGIGYVREQPPRSGGAFCHHNGTLAFIPKLAIGAAADRMSVARHINNAGQIVGVSGNIRGSRHAFLCDQNTVYDLGTLGSWWSDALAINNHGDVVGYSGPPHQRDVHAQALLWQQRTLINLNDYTRGTGWELKVAVDINDNGQIVGWGVVHGVSRIFLMNPVV